MDDLEDLTQSCEAASEGLELPYPSYKEVSLLIAQLRTECKDSVSLLKIQNVLQSYKRLIEFKINHCELLKGQMEKMENRVTGLQKELSEIKEVKSQLEHEKIEQEQELCNVRFALKQEEEKRETADLLCEKNKERLNRKEEQYNREVKVNQQLKNSLRMLDMELKTVRDNLDQLQEAQDRHKEAVQRAEKMEDHLQKLKLENSKLKVTIKKQAEENERLQKNLTIANLLQEAHDQHKGTVRTAELELENSKLKVIIEKQTVENQQLQKNLLSTNMELLSLKTIEKKCLKLQKSKKKMEQEVVTLKCHIENNVVEHGRVQQYKQEIEARARQDLEEKLKQVNEFLQTQAEIRSQMEVKIKCLETELSEMKAQEESYKIQLNVYQETCLKGFEITRSLSNQLKTANEKLEEAGRELLAEKRRNRHARETHSARPLLEFPYVGIHNSSLVLNQRFIPGGNLVAPASDSWPSNESMQNLETRMLLNLNLNSFEPK
uniref:Ankyrin repeat domain-containing protein 26-like n=2 Tax=Chinchilla lanigera TaxID=34839 RepID=A0A8C2VX41_CHILA